MSWSINEIGNLKDKVFIVTGSNAGLGYETALALAKLGATVIMACRSQKKAMAAIQKIKEQVPKADLHFRKLDLASLASVKSFAKEYMNEFSHLDVLINNAGLAMPPYSKTEDGFELQMGVNYFGHFLLTGMLMDVLKKTPDSRIVTVSSLAHAKARIRFEDIHWEKSYHKMDAYRQSKLACLLFSLELDRRLKQAGHQTKSIATHPGVSITEIVRHVPKVLYYALYPFLSLGSHHQREGAKPILLAALDPSLVGGEYCGPTGSGERVGPPGLAKIRRPGRDEEAAKKLWELSEELLGFNFEW